jgi:hypothetical protein
MWKQVSLYHKYKKIVKFNKICFPNPKDIQYVVLLPWTEKFNLLQDLRNFFKKQASINDFIMLCKKNKFCVLYSTLFTKKEIKKFNGITRKVSHETCVEILNDVYELYPDVVIVSSNQKGFRAKVITPNHFMKVVLK